MTPSEREAKAAYMREYRKRDSYKCYVKQYRKSEVYQRVQARAWAKYRTSEKGIATRRAFLNYQKARKRNNVAEISALKQVLNSEPIFVAARACVPISIPNHVRDDIISDICLAILEGDFGIDEAPKHARRIINANWRKLERFNLSLDASIGDNRTLYDVIAQ